MKNATRTVIDIFISVYCANFTDLLIVLRPNPEDFS